MDPRCDISNEHIHPLILPTEDLTGTAASQIYKGNA